MSRLEELVATEPYDSTIRRDRGVIECCTCVVLAGALAGRRKVRLPATDADALGFLCEV